MAADMIKMPQLDRDAKIRDVMSRVIKAEQGFKELKENNPGFEKKFERYKDYSLAVAKEYMATTLEYQQDKIKKDGAEKYVAAIQKLADKYVGEYSKAYRERDIETMVSIVHKALEERAIYVFDSPDILPGEETTVLIERYIDKIRSEQRKKGGKG